MIKAGERSSELVLAQIETRLQQFCIELMKPTVSKITSVHENFWRMHSEHAELHSRLQTVAELQKTMDR